MLYYKNIEQKFELHSVLFWHMMLYSIGRMNVCIDGTFGINKTR